MNSRSGFTLIEVLLAMAILAIVTATIYASFSTAGSTVKRAEEVRDGTDTARTLIARLSTDIENAYLNSGMNLTFLYGRKSQDEESNRRFDGISLTTLTNWRKPGTQQTDLWEVGYYFQEKPDGNGRILIRREKKELSKAVPPLEGGVEYEVTDAVEGLQLRYWNGSSWSDEWDTRSQNRLPRAVEIVLTLADGRVYATETDVRGY